MSHTNGKAIKVAICSPCGDQVMAMWAHDYARMAVYTVRRRPDIQMMSVFVPGSLVVKQREMLACEILKEGYTHALWLDTDMRFPPDTMLRLLDRHKRFVAANYVERRSPYVPNAFPDLQTPNVRLFTEPGDTGLAEVQAVGFGVVLMEADVLRQMPRPWFAAAWVKEMQEYMGEDVYFCNKAREHGERLWLDHDLSKEIAHLGTHPFSMAEAYQARENGLQLDNQPEPVKP